MKFYNHEILSKVHNMEGSPSGLDGEGVELVADDEGSEDGGSSSLHYIAKQEIPGWQCIEADEHTGSSSDSRKGARGCEINLLK